MILNINDIINYSICPNRYRLSKSKIINDDIEIEKKYSSVLRKSIFSYFSSIQNNNRANYGSLKRTFGNLWIGEKSLSEFIFSEPKSWRNIEEQKRKKGLITLNKFNEYFKNNLNFPVLINYEYKVPINNSIFITGTIDLIVEDDRKLNLIMFRSNDIKNDYDYVNKSLKITAANYAFEKLFKEKINKIYVYGLNKNSINITFRNNNDYELFKKYVLNIAKCIHNNIFYISPNAYCSKCYYNNICNKEVE